MTIKKAFMVLHSARNDRRRPIQEVLNDIDMVGRWAAGTGKNTPGIIALIREAHETYQRVSRRA